MSIQERSPITKELIALTLCLVVGFALRYYSFDRKSLWVDEVHTYNDSRDGLKDQIKFYKDNPAFLHPPLFFLLTHQFHPFTKPERDLRIIPLIFGTLSIPLIYLLARFFSSQIALPCALSLTFMTYHISLSQEGRSYALLMFLGMASLYFFMKHLETRKRRYLIGVAVFFSALFHTSYSSIPFIAFAQALWFYQAGKDSWKRTLLSVLFLNGFTLLLCSPWIIFIVRNYGGEAIMDPSHTEDPGSFAHILYGVLHDWVPFAPLAVVATTLLALFPIASRSRRNALVLLGIFILPIAGLYSYCKVSEVKHFITSRYFITFLPVFLISLYLSIVAFESGFTRLRQFLRLRILFVILFVLSNILLLPLYYQSEKQNLRGLVTYLKDQMKPGDKIFVESTAYIPGILHYFGDHPEMRHHKARLQIDSAGDTRYTKPFSYRGREFRIHQSKDCCSQYVADGNRLWIVTVAWRAKGLKKNSPCVLKGFFDGSFLNFNKFPEDASIYLFLWDPSSSDEKGIDMPLE
jgi:mannosyltransferase